MSEDIKKEDVLEKDNTPDTVEKDNISETSEVTGVTETNKTEVTDETEANKTEVSETVDTEAVIKEVLSGENLAEPSGIGKDKEALANLVFDKKDNDDEGKAKPGLKVFGVISILLAIAGLAVIGLAFYFLVFAPVYDKSADYNGSVPYDNIASVTDASYSDKKEPLEMISTSLDATPLDATSLDATETDADASVED